MIDHASLIGKLHDIHPPPSDGFSEIIIMSLLGAIVAAACVIYYYNKYYIQRNRFRKAFEIIQSSRDHAAADRLAMQARALREVAASTDPGAQFLQGEDWLSRLDTILHTSFFTQGHGRIFGEELYKPMSSGTMESLDSELGHLLARLKNERN